MFQAIYKGPTYLNKSSDEQKSAANQNQEFTTQLENQFNQEFQGQQQIQGSLGAQLASITNQGLAGKGFLNGEEADLQTNAKEAEANQNAQNTQALATKLGTMNEGGSQASGATAQLAERGTAGAAADAANASRGIVLQNDALARQNVSEGLGGLSALNGQEASQASALAGTASSNAANSYNEVTQAYQPSNFWGNLAGSVVGAVLPGAGNLLAGAINGPAVQPLQTGGADPIGLNSSNAGPAPAPVDMSSALSGGMPNLEEDDNYD